MLWTLFGEPMHANTSVMGKYAPDLMKDRFYRVLNTWHWVPLVLLGLGLLAIGGLPWLLWGTLRPDRLRVALHVVRELGDPSVGIPSIRDKRRLQELVVGRPAHLWRGLAQQPSCGAHLGASQSDMGRT